MVLASSAANLPARHPTCRPAHQAERVGPEVPRLLVNRERAGEAYGPYGRGFRFDKGNYRWGLIVWVAVERDGFELGSVFSAVLRSA